MATPEHTCRGQGEEGVRTVQAAFPCKSEDEHYSKIWQVLVLGQERP